MRIKVNWGQILRVFVLSMVSVGGVSVLAIFFFYGLITGYTLGSADREVVTLSNNIPSPVPYPSPIVVQQPSQRSSLLSVNWGGPELWEKVNKRRVELGVNPLGQRDELCTVASIRLNEQLELGKLDGHEGFSSLPDRRPDLKYIFEKYNISEFLLSGAQSADEAVSLWENTLGHKKLLTGGEYVFGCIYAQNSFAVAITAF